MRTREHHLELARLGDAPIIAVMSSRLIEAGLTPSWPAERVARHIRNADSLVLTARNAERLIGFAIMQYGEEAAHLNLLAVDSGSQRRGIGRALLGWLEETALVAGTFLIQLELRASNATARAFYESRGYRETGRVAGYYQRLEDAVQMGRNLAVGAAQT
jgi:ribosomal protein S18 acetylase RimI-like enzyme